MGLENAIKVLETLHSYGLQASIAGGAARDMFFGLEPKDYDIIVFNIYDKQLAAEAAHRYNPSLSVDYFLSLPISDLMCWATNTLLSDFRPAVPGQQTPGDLYVEGTYSIYHSKEDTDDQLVEVHKFNDGIDVLVYEPAESLFEALEMFDFNLNQFALIGPEKVPEYLGIESLESLVKTRLDPDYNRVRYMEAKFAEMQPLIEQAISEGRLF